MSCLAPGMRTLLSPLIALCLFPGCSTYVLATPPKHARIDVLGPVPAKVGRVCVFRTSVVGFASTIAIIDDGKVVGATRGRGYFCYLASPGQHQIVAEDGDAEPANLGAEAGKRYFLHHEVNFGADRLMWVEASRAQELAAQSDYQLVVDGLADEPLPGDVPVAPALAIVGQ